MMAQDRTRLIVRKTLEQLRGELTGEDYLKSLAIFEARLDFNLDLAGIGKIAGRKPNKPVKPRPQPPANRPSDHLT